jgi:hypothetical protein
MKAFLWEEDNGGEYDDYEHWVSHVFIVPDDFDVRKERERILNVARNEKICRFKVDGNPYWSDWKKFEKYFLEYMQVSYQEYKIVTNE